MKAGQRKPLSFPAVESVAVVDRIARAIEGDSAIAVRRFLELHAAIFEWHDSLFRASVAVIGHVGDAL